MGERCGAVVAHCAHAKPGNAVFKAILTLHSDAPVDAIVQCLTTELKWVGMWKGASHPEVPRKDGERCCQESSVIA